MIGRWLLAAAAIFMIVNCASAPTVQAEQPQSKTAKKSSKTQEKDSKKQAKAGGKNKRASKGWSCGATAPGSS